MNINEIFPGLPTIPYFPGQNIICGIVFFIHGGGIFNFPIIGPIINIIRRYLLHAIAYIIVFNILIHYLEDYIKRWIDNLPTPISTLIKGFFDIITFNVSGYLSDAEELAEEALLNGWWDPGPLNIKGTCKERFGNKNYSVDYSLWKKEKWEDVRANDSTYGTKNGKPGKLDDLCEGGLDCPDTADLFGGTPVATGYLNGINIGNAPRKFKDCCDMNIDFCRGKTVADNPRMPIIPHVGCAVGQGAGYVGGAASAIGHDTVCGTKWAAWHAKELICGSGRFQPSCDPEPTCSAENVGESAHREAQRLLHICQNKCIADAGCNNDVNIKQSENAVRKKLGDEIITFEGCVNENDPGCFGDFRHGNLKDAIFSIKSILYEYVFNKFWFWGIVLPIMIYYILLFLCQLTVSGKALYRLNKGYSKISSGKLIPSKYRADFNKITGELKDTVGKEGKKLLDKKIGSKAMKYADKAGIKGDTIDGLKGKLKGDISNKVNKSISKVGNKLFEPVVVQAEN
jgi:hypothetical protein